MTENEAVTSPRTGASLRITHAPTSERDFLSVDRVFKPGMGRFPEHVHLDFAETFKIEKGVAEAKVGGDTLRLTAGKAFHVPRGVPHVNPYNADIEDLTLAQKFDPATEGARSYVQTLERVLWQGRDDDGELPAAVILALGDVTRERTYLTGPRWGHGWGEATFFALQRRCLLPLGRAVAGARGYEVYLTSEP
jgi:mannose-6-phosphate isomerase-like protein (cupin superfamily)